MDDLHCGTGFLQPEDAEEFAEITIFVENGIIADASFRCTEADDLTDCVKTVCRVITDKPFADVLQMNNNAVYYNMEGELTRSRLYLATIAVAAAKKAVLDYCKKNEIELPPDSGLCSCFN